MHLQKNVCYICKSFVHIRFETKVSSIAKFHHYPVLSAKTQAVLKEQYSHHNGDNVHKKAESNKQEKKTLRISSRRSEYNHYSDKTYGKFDNVPLVSKGWHHRKSRGDFFTLHSYRENPAILTSSEPNTMFGDLGINSNIISILEKQNIINPTNIQKDGIPKILKGVNTLLTAETGCGKTLAYLLPMIEQVLTWQNLIKDRKLNHPLGLIILPNRELANQIGEVAAEFSRRLMFTTKVLLGGHTKRQMLNPSYEQVDLLIATLGALSKLTSTGVYKMTDVHHVVLDEADTLLDDSFNEKLCHFLKKISLMYKSTDIASGLPRGSQLTLVSATMPTSLPDILGDIINTESLVKVTSTNVHRILPHVPQKFYRLSNSQKPAQLLRMVKEDSAKRNPIMIFSNKSSTCDWISMFLNENGISCVNLNSKMCLDIRNGKLEQFQSGNVNVISCTDIGSRGIDTIRVKHVINYNFPLYMADYIHRCGRTGRVGSTQGCHVSNFISGWQEVDLVQKIETAARKMDELPNVNANIKRTIGFRKFKAIEEEMM